MPGIGQGAIGEGVRVHNEDCGSQGMEMYSAPTDRSRDGQKT